MSKIAGITVEHKYRRSLPIVSIDLNKHKDLIPILEDKGVQISPKIKISAKLKRSIREAENGEVVRLDTTKLFD